MSMTDCTVCLQTHPPLQRCSPSPSNRESAVAFEREEARLEGEALQRISGRKKQLWADLKAMTAKSEPQRELSDTDLDDLESMMDGAYDLRHMPVEPLRDVIRELRTLRAAGGEA